MKTIELGSTDNSQIIIKAAAAMEFRAIEKLSIWVFVLSTLVVVSARADSESAWRLAGGVHASGRTIKQSVMADESRFTLEDNNASGAELSISRRIWEDWRLTGCYAQLRGEESGQWPTTLGGEPAAVNSGNEISEQLLGAQMLRLFSWGEKWTPYLGLGLVYNRFEGDVFLEGVSVNGTNEKVLNQAFSHTNWFYTGVGGIEFHFSDAWSTEMELQYFGHLAGEFSEDAGIDGVLRLAYRF